MENYILSPKEDMQRGRALSKYIKEMHTQKECIGFIDGFERALVEMRDTPENENLEDMWSELTDEIASNKPSVENFDVNIHGGMWELKCNEFIGITTGDKKSCIVVRKQLDIDAVSCDNCGSFNLPCKTCG